MFSRFFTSFSSKKKEVQKPHKRGQTMRETPPAFDLAIKRRANSVEKKDRNEGHAFILPKRDVPEKPRKLFFFDKEPLTHQALLAQVAQLTTSQVFRVAIILDLRPRNVERLNYFISRISQTDESMLERVQKALNDVTNQSRPVTQNVSPYSTTDYPFFDLRYKPVDNGPVIFATPIDMGLTPVSFEFKLPVMQQGYRVILQSFMVGVSPPTVRWASTLIIKVNGIFVKSPGPYFSPLLDISAFPPGSLVSIMAGPEGCQYKFIARCAKYTSFKEFAKMLRNAPHKKEVFNENDCSLFCPMSGEPLVHPVKGNQCQHSQAFELKTYLQRGIVTGKFFCPVCGMPVPPEALIYSHCTQNLIFNSKSRTVNKQPAPVEDLLTQPPQNPDQIIFEDEPHGEYEFF